MAGAKTEGARGEVHHAGPPDRRGGAAASVPEAEQPRGGSSLARPSTSSLGNSGSLRGGGGAQGQKLVGGAIFPITLYLQSIVQHTWAIVTGSSVATLPGGGRSSACLASILSLGGFMWSSYCSRRRSSLKKAFQPPRSHSSRHKSSALGLCPKSPGGELRSGGFNTGCGCFHSEPSRHALIIHVRTRAITPSERTKEKVLHLISKRTFGPPDERCSSRGEGSTGKAAGVMGGRSRRSSAASRTALVISAHASFRSSHEVTAIPFLGRICSAVNAVEFQAQGFTKIGITFAFPSRLRSKARAISPSQCGEARKDGVTSRMMIPAASRCSSSFAFHVSPAGTRPLWVISMARDRSRGARWRSSSAARSASLR